MILIAFLSFALSLLYCAAEAWYERSFPRKMIKFVGIFAALLLCAVTAFGQQLQRYDNHIFTTSSNVPYGAVSPLLTAPGATITVCPLGTTPCTSAQPLSSLFSDINGQIPLPNPVTTDAGGNFGFYIAPGNYVFSALTASGQLKGPFPFTVGGSQALTASAIAGALTYTPASIDSVGAVGSSVSALGASLSGVSTAVSSLNTSVSNAQYSSIDTFGNSIVQGTGATTFMEPGQRGQQVCWPGNLDLGLSCYANGPTAFAYLLQADFGNAGHNYGRGGDADPDVSLHVATWAHPTLENNPVRTGLEGTNDVSIYGTNTNQQDTVKKAVLFEIAQGVIPDAVKQFASSASATGTWTADANYPGAMYSTTSGSALTFSFPSSTAVAYLAYMKCDNTSNGAASVTVNGKAGALEPTILAAGLAGSAIVTASGSHCGFALARNTGVVGTNTMTVSTTNGGAVEVFWAAGSYTAPAGAVAPPIWVEGGTPWGQNDAFEPASGQYDAIDAAAVTLLAGDGNNVKFANLRAYLNSTTDYTGGGGVGPSGQPWNGGYLPLHPGDGGHYKIYRAFHDQLPAQPAPSQALSLWGGPFGYITGANSVGGRYGADTGDQLVPTATTLTLHSDTSTPLKDTSIATAVGSAGINFEVKDKTFTNRNLTLRYWGNSQYTANLSQVFGLEDLGDTTFPWLYSGTTTAWCSQVAESNANTCNGATLLSLPNGQVSVGGGTISNPGVIAGSDSSSTGVNLKIASGVNARDARLIISQESTNGGNPGGKPEIWIYNANAPANKRVQLMFLDENGNFQITRCTDSLACTLVSYITPSGQVVDSLGLQLPYLKSTSGSRTLCVDTQGNVTSVAGPCPSGT